MKEFLKKYGNLICIISAVAGIIACTIVSIVFNAGASGWWFLIPAIIGLPFIAWLVYFFVYMLIIIPIKKIVLVSKR